MDAKLLSLAVAVMMLSIPLSFQALDSAERYDESVSLEGSLTNSYGTVRYVAEKEYGHSVTSGSGGFIFTGVSAEDRVTCRIVDSQGSQLKVVEDFPATGLPFKIPIDLDEGRYNAILSTVTTKEVMVWTIDVKEMYDVRFLSSSDLLADVAVAHGDGIGKNCISLTNLLDVSGNTATFTPFSHWDTSAAGTGAVVTEDYVPVWNTDLYAIWGESTEMTVKYTSAYVL